MFKKNVLLGATMMGATLLTGCMGGNLKPKDTTPVVVPHAEMAPTQEELKALVLRKYNLMEKYLSYWFLWNNRMH